jgi:hypothetical protein
LATVLKIILFALYQLSTIRNVIADCVRNTEGHSYEVDLFAAEDCDPLFGSQSVHGWGWLGCSCTDVKMVASPYVPGPNDPPTLPLRQTIASFYFTASSSHKIIFYSAKECVNAPNTNELSLVGFYFSFRCANALFLVPPSKSGDYTMDDLPDIQRATIKSFRVCPNYWPF